MVAQGPAPRSRRERVGPDWIGDMVHFAFAARRARAATLQDGNRHLDRGVSARDRDLRPHPAAAGRASDGAPHARLHPRYGLDDDLRRHAAYDAPLLLLALPGRVALPSTCGVR